MDDDDELLDVLDEQGNVVGQKSRADVHRAQDRHGLVFAWSAWVDEGRGVMVLQRRSRSDDPFAARVDALAGGHIGAGETPVDAALREMQEEVGISAHAADFVHLGSMRKDRPIGGCSRVIQHQLLYSVPVRLEALQFSAEVDGFIRVDLFEYAALALGERERIPASARFAGADGIVTTELLRSHMDYPDAILDTFRRSLASIQDWLREGLINPAHFEQ